MRHQILVVDDQPALAGMIAQLLSDAGYRTRTADDGRGALAEIRSNPPDLLVTDVYMPEMDGFALASSLKADPATAAIPIIMLSAKDGRASRVIGLESGAEDYLAKPVDPVELLAKVRNLLLLRERSAGDAAH